MVDDNPGDLQLIEEAFRDCRIEVAFIAATEPRSALDYLERAAAGTETRPDVLILDLNLPGMHGREVIDTLRGSPVWRGLPVVVLTGERAGAEGLPVDEVVAKPDSYAKYCALARRLRRFWSPRGGDRDHTPAAASATAR
jgi:CheY-like chemotaxis protein